MPLCKQCKPLQDPGFSDFGKWREITDRPADAAQGVQFFYTLIDEQLARLEELLAVHEEIAGDEAGALADRASFDGSAGGERLRRMQTARSRELRQTLELLMKMQKGENNGQAVCDGGMVKDGEETAMETPASARGPKVASSNDDQREPGSASKPASKKRPQDKYRSTRALEMMMSGRLDEQGFEKFFADPPAALVVIKGLQRLAELKTLHGLAPVEARGAGEGVMGELGMKKAQIEANGNETQAEKRPEDNMHGHDSGGEKRTQMGEPSCQARCSLVENPEKIDRAGGRPES